MPTDRRALREEWCKAWNWDAVEPIVIYADERETELDDLITRAIQAGRAEMLEACIAATRDERDMYWVYWDDERPFDAMIERLEALKEA